MTSTLPVLRTATAPVIINLEDGSYEDTKVPEDVVGHDLVAIHGEGWENSADDSPDASDPLVLALGQWLGTEAVKGMRTPEIEALLRGVARLPEPEPESSFVWEAVRRPEDIPQVAEAVLAHRRFDAGAVAVSDAMGPNVHFRKVIRWPHLDGASRLGDVLDSEWKKAGSVVTFREQLDVLAGAMGRLFGDHDFTIAAALVALAASDAMAQSLPLVRDGFGVERLPSEEELDVLDSMRRKVVAASDAVRKAAQIVPLRYSHGVLSGVRRSIDEKRAADFIFAVEALGGRMESKERILDAGIAFAEYFRHSARFSDAVRDLGYAAFNESRLVAHVLVRRHLRSAARSLEIPWEDVRGFLQMRTDVNAGEFEEQTEAMRMEGVSGRLAAVCRNRNKKLAEVGDAAYRAAVEREYWLAAGERVRKAWPEITVAEVREIAEMEPSIAQSKETLRRYGVTVRSDLVPLERHLEWMISAYALPVPDEAVQRIVDTRAAIIPWSLMLDN